jgi:hypothetical protein
VWVIATIQRMSDPGSPLQSALPSPGLAPLEPAELRLARGMARDTTFAGKEGLWRTWMREEDEFFAADGTRDRADIIVDTSKFGADSAQ